MMCLMKDIQEGKLLEMKIMLLGEKKENSFVRMIEQRHSVEWVSKLTDAGKECAFIIIMAEDEAKSAAKKNELLGQGLAEEIILEYCYFRKDPAVSRIEYFQKEYCRYEYDSFWFGMSHSLGGMIEDIIKRKSIFKFSAPSMDLYYHYQVIKRLEELYDMTKIKNIYFELPYYIFNYDVSKCVSVFRERINFFYYLQDYHHFTEIQSGKRYADMFERMNELAGNRFYGQFSAAGENMAEHRRDQRLVRAKRSVYYALCNKEKHRWTEDEICTAEALRPHVWYKTYIDTIEENRKIWQSILAWLDEHKWIKMQVVVFPFSPYFIRANQKAIAAKKKEFFEGIGLPPDRIIDLFEYYMNRPEYFADECHLIEKGAYEFSKKVNRILS